MESGGIVEEEEEEEEEEEKTVSSRIARLSTAGSKFGSCGCGFDGVVRWGQDLVNSLRQRPASLDNDTTSTKNRCANFVDVSCVGKLVSRSEEAYNEHVSQLKEQTKESLLQAQKAYHEIEDLKAQLSAKESIEADLQAQLQMANRQIEIAEQGKEQCVRQIEDELRLVSNEKEEMQEDMEQRVKDLTKERDEAIREKATLERPWWWGFVECQSRVLRSLSQCCAERMCIRRLPLPCLPIDKLMRFRPLEGKRSPQPQVADSENHVGEEPPEAPLRPRSSSNPYRDSGRRDLINALLESQWPYVSEWFKQQMRDVVEPLLQEQLATMIPGIKIKIGHTCDLGDMPVQLENIKAETCTEVMPDGGERIENLQIVGSLNYHGNAMVDVGVSEWACEIGNLSVTGLQVQGVVVIELVKLTQVPPWFSGVRIFFPNPPRVDICLRTKLKGVQIDAISTVIKHKILQVLEEKVLGQTVVLPNRICIGLGERMEDVSLRHPRPQGVLRLAVLRAQSLRNIRSGGSWYVPWSKKTADGVNVNPYVVIALGAEHKQTRQCTKTLNPEWGNEICDLLVTDLDQQSLRITVRDHESGVFSTSDHILGRTEVPLAKIAETSAQPEGQRLLLFSESGWWRVGHVMIQAQWRPFAQVNEITRAMTHPNNCWGFGDRSEVSWLLAADIFYASGLPTCDEGTAHWATMTISGFRRPDAPDFPETKETAVACAAGPFEHGLKLLDNIGLEKGVMIDDERKQVGRTMWRKKVRLGAAAADQERSGTRFVDVVWNCPLTFLMDRVTGVKVKISVLRPARGRTRPPPGSTEVETLGSFEHTLRMEELGGRMILDIHPALNNSGTEMKLRLQASPLMAPTEPSNFQAGRNRLPRYSQRLGQAASGFCTNRAVIDAQSREASNATSSVDSISFAPELPPVSEDDVMSTPIDKRPRAASQQPRGWFSWARPKGTAPSLETPSPSSDSSESEAPEETIPVVTHTTSTSGWRIVKWWKGQEDIAPKLEDDSCELTLLRQNYSASELIAFDSPSMQTSFQETSPEHTTVPRPVILSDHPPTPRRWMKRVHSDPLLLANDATVRSASCPNFRPIL